MNILVTGGAGYIGSHTAQLLAANGHLPIVYDDLSMGHREFARFGPFEYGTVLDVARLEQVLRAYRVDWVVHCAAKALVSEAAQFPERYVETNVGGMATLLRAMKATGVQRLVFSSSAAIYGEGTGTLLKESDPAMPVNAYGLSKLQAEQALAAIAPTFGLRWAVLRFFNVVGSDADNGLREWHEPETHLVPNLFRAAHARVPFHLFGSDYPTPDGTAVRDYVDVRDLAAIHVEALVALESRPTLLSNVGRGKGFSVTEVLTAARSAWGMPIDVATKPRRPGDPAHLVADDTFLKTWSAAAKRGLRPLEDSLRAMTVRLSA